MGANLDGDEACSHGFTGLPEDCVQCAREAWAKAMQASYEAGRREGIEQLYDLLFASGVGDEYPQSLAVAKRRALREVPTPPPQAACGLCTKPYAKCTCDPATAPIVPGDRTQAAEPTGSGCAWAKRVMVAVQSVVGPFTPEQSALILGQLFPAPPAAPAGEGRECACACHRTLNLLRSPDACSIRSCCRARVGRP